jgi:prevent-host-death family protein
MPKTVGIRELKQDASHILQTVREESAEYVVTYHGKPVAIIRPFTGEDAALQLQAAVEDELRDLQRLGQEIAAAWVSPKGAVDLVEEQRR